jgi:hypothetical protein
MKDNRVIIEETKNDVEYAKLNDLGKFTIYSEKNVEFCGDCINKKIESDPDPDDSFCMDSKLICTKKGKKVEGCLSGSEQDRVKIPDWCPILEELNSKN